MIIIGFLGSPRLNGICARMLQSTLDGAASCGAEIQRYDLIRCNIKYCLGCCTCFLNSPELAIGTCPLKDDMRDILEKYLMADGYVFASPVYDVFVSALMKTFLERKIMLTYRDKKAHCTIPGPRRPAAFKKKAALILTANSADDLEEVMGEPAFEAWQAHLPIEQVDTVDQLFIGGVETIDQTKLSSKLDEAYTIGTRLVSEIQRANKESTVLTYQ